MEGSKGCPVPLAIASYIEANPRASDRQVAQELGVSPTTVGDARATRNVQNGQIEQIDSSRPIERAKAAARTNPEASEKKIAELAEVSPNDCHVRRKQDCEYRSHRSSRSISATAAARASDSNRAVVAGRS